MGAHVVLGRKRSVARNGARSLLRKVPSSIMHFSAFVLYGLAFSMGGSAQTPVPDQGVVIDDGLWTADSHVHWYANTIIGSSAASPLTITADANAELVSGTQVHLTENFHAGGFGANGHFRAWIDDAQGTAADLVQITPDPATHVINNVMHVEKWEKLELGLKPPQDFVDAIDTFFDHYYSNGVAMPATPGMVDPQYDLNPYADDSLQLVMRLTSPSGIQKMKWGFFMREAQWESAALSAMLEDYPDAPLNPYSIRFRVSPDETGTWNFTITLKAPYTVNDDGILYQRTFADYSFVCDSPLPDNHGSLHVNQTNHRNLQFEDGAAFFGLGTNMATTFGNPPDTDWRDFHYQSFTTMKTTMAQLHSVGGNYLRVFLANNTFAPEWVNLGVYDHYTEVSPCELGPMVPTRYGNCQAQCWAFDQLLDHARNNNIYMQLCPDAYAAPGGGYETFAWGSHPYVINYLDPARDQSTGRYDIKKFFYTNGDPSNVNTGVFYYWKRKYKYMMARWGYSVNIAMLELTNEMDQMLTIKDQDLHDIPGPNPIIHYDICQENRILWPEDTDLIPTINEWINDITEYVRGPVDLLDPVNSSLGESNKLFSISYTEATPAVDQNNLPNSSHFLPFNNPNIDVNDVHRYIYEGEYRIKDDFDESQAYRNTFPANAMKKPFIRGEYGTWGYIDHDGNSATPLVDTKDFFSNYDVSFHNEIWATTFSGSMSCALSWFYPRIFWWPDALPESYPDIPRDDNNTYEQYHTGVLGAPNLLEVGLSNAVPVVNKTIYHNFKPLHNLLTNPNWQGMDFFSGKYTPHRIYDETNELECYYLISEDELFAVGWVHNLNAYYEKQYYYLAVSSENFLGCAAPTAQPQHLLIPGLQSGTEFYVSFFSTRMNTTEHPTGYLDQSGTGNVLLDLSTAPFNGIANNYLDTLHSDYAFIIALNYVPKSLSVPGEAVVMNSDWDFKMFPNPTSTELNLLLPDDTISKDIVIYDLTGKRLAALNSFGKSLLNISTEHFAKGAYCVRVSDVSSTKIKTLIIH